MALVELPDAAAQKGAYRGPGGGNRAREKWQQRVHVERPQGTRDGELGDGELQHRYPPSGTQDPAYLLERPLRIRDVAEKKREGYDIKAGGREGQILRPALDEPNAVALGGCAPVSYTHLRAHETRH